MRRSSICAVLWLALLGCTGPLRADEGTPRVTAPRGNAPLAFGAAQIRQALREAPEGASGAAVVIEPPSGRGRRESFRISVTRQGPRLMVRVSGADTRGVLYGALDVAEQIHLGGGVRALRPRQGAPFLPIRALKFNLPLEGTGYLSAEDQQHNAWFYDLDYWRGFLEAMASWRYNALTLWSAHPYDRMVRLAKYPEASALSADEMRRSIAFFHALFRMARDRGVDTYIVTWNIHTSRAFQRAHGVRDGQDSPLIRDYQKECIRELLREYPELTGIGTCPGEQMGGSADWREEWIRDTYLRGIAESGRVVPFIHRYWGSTPAATARMLAAARYPAPVLLDIKFNGEHMYSSPRPHLQETTWLTQRPRPYRLLWHLRNDCIFQLRWGDPDFARQTVRSCGGWDSAGFVMGSEIEIPGADRFHTAEAASHRTWRYEFEKNWMRFAVWGRMGYNPDEPDEQWAARFEHRFGGGAGRDAFLALRAASRVVPLATSFHWNYMNGDWYPEGNVGGWNTSAEMPFANYRDRAMFHSVREWILNHTIDASLQSIPDYVADRLARRPPPKGALTPPQVADRFDEAAEAAERHLRLAAGRVARGKGEWECTEADLRALAALGRYYGAKVRGATELMWLLATGDEAHREAAIAHLEKAREHWRALAAVTGRHYIPHEVWLFGQFDWGRYQPDVDQDVETAREIRPWSRTEQVWAWNTGERSTCALGWQAEGWGNVAAWLAAFTARACGAAPPPPTAGRTATATLRADRAGWAVLRLNAERPTSVQVNGTPVPVSRGGQHLCAVPVRAGDNEVRVSFPGAPSSTPVAVWEMVAGGPEASLIEAESGQLARPMRVRQDAGALGGRVIVLPKGAGRGQAPDGRIVENGWARYRVRVPSDGEYVLWARVWWPDTSANSFFYAWDAAAPRILGNDEEFGRWHWVQTRPERLTVGEHTLTIRNRDEGSILDCLAVVRAER